MSLRTRLFLLFGSLIAVLLCAQWMMWRSLTHKLDQELNSVAFAVGRDVASFFSNDGSPTPLILPPQEAHRLLSGGHWKEKVKVHKVDENGETTHYAYKFSVKGGQADLEFVPKTKDPDAPETQNSRRVLTHEAEHRLVTPEHGTDEEQKPTITVEVTTGDNTPKADQSSALDPAKKEGVASADQAIDPPVIHQRHILKRTGQPTIVVDSNLNEEDRTLILSLDKDDLILAEPHGQKRIPIPKTGISERLADTQQRYLMGSAGILALGLLLAGFAAHRFSQPLRRLATAATEVGDGQLGRQVPDQATGEVGVAIGAFNKMSQRLKELDDSARSLQQRQYLSELGEIANGLAHTIRNPLNTLGLSLEQLAALSAQHEQSQELAQLGRHQIRRIDQWIRSFLALASQGVSREERIDLRRIIEDVVLEAIQDGSKSVELDLNLPDTLPEFAGVAPELRAVVQALVVNAVEASPEGATVRLDLYIKEETLHLDITDQGPGLDPSVREKLFTPHVTTKTTGSGMGLFLANRIVSSRYRGSVSLNDGPDGGTIARISLPLQNHQQSLIDGETTLSPRFT